MLSITVDSEVAADQYAPCATPDPKTPKSAESQSRCMKEIIDNFNTAINNFNETLRFKMLYQKSNVGWNPKPAPGQEPSIALADIPDNQWHMIVQAHTNIQDYCWKYSYLLEDLDHDPGKVAAINTLLQYYGERIQAMLPTLVQQAHEMNPDTIVSAQRRIITQYESLFGTLSQTSILTEETKGKVSQLLNDLKALPTH